MPTTTHGKHRAPSRPTGPVTAAFAVLDKKQPKPIRIIATIWPVIPPLALIPAALHGHLLAYADAVLGYDATLCLIACLAITPLITVMKVNITKLRWYYGVMVFFIALAGLGIHLAYPPGNMQTRAAGNVIDWTGLLILTFLTPMAITSCKAAQKLLGPEWKKWQRNLMWCVYAAVIIHFLTMHAWLITIAYLAATAPMFTLRKAKIRKAVKTWRADGYSTGGWWVILMTLTVIFAIGIMILIGQEVQSIASAVESA